MKLVKMSLLAATLIATSAFAIDNVKVAGDANLYYSTNDGVVTPAEGITNANPDASLFDDGSSSAQASIHLGVTADLTEGISTGLAGYGLTSLGLYNTIVTNIWETSVLDGNNINNAGWISEAWLAGTMGKTTAKIGLMELDTPMVYTEKWSTAANTFGAAVLINQDLPGTTLVGAYVGQSNGSASSINTSDLQGLVGATPTGTLGYGGVINGTGKMGSFYSGAYAAGVVNNSWEPLTVQAWYYQAQSVMNAYWLQADLKIVGLDLGLQYAGQDFGGLIADADSESVFAGKIGYEMKDVFTISGAYSQVADNNGFGNVGMNLATLGQSKLYTEAWWNYGYITQADTSSFNISLTTPEALTWASLGLFYTDANQGDGGKQVGTGNKGTDMSEIAVTASKTFGPLDTSLVYFNTTADDQNVKAGDTKGSAYNTVQVYLTYNF